MKFYFHLLLLCTFVVGCANNESKSVKKNKPADTTVIGESVAVENNEKLQIDTLTYGEQAVMSDKVKQSNKLDLTENYNVKLTLPQLELSDSKFITCLTL